MALGMKHWLGLLAGGFAVVVVWLLPPDAFQPRGAPTRSHEGLRYEVLRRELNNSYATLQRIRWRDSLTTLAARSAVDGLAVLAPESARRERAELERYLRRVEARIQPRDPNVVVAIVYQHLAHGRAPGSSTDERSRTETYVTERDGVTYCLRIELSKVPQRGLDDDLQRYRSASARTSRIGSAWYGALGACRLYARYGSPGAHVRAWLGRGAAHFATAADPGGRAWMYCAAGRRCREGRKSLFGHSILGFNRTLTLDECLAAEADSCGAIFLDPSLAARRVALERPVAERAGALAIGDRMPWAGIINEGRYLLADLEEAFGPEAFRRFWRSGEPVGEAFESAFATGLDTWALSWFEAEIGVDPPGPRLARAATFGTFLTVSLFAAFAAAVNRRRRVA